MDPTLPQVAPKKFPRGLIIGGIVVSLVIIIAVGLWLLGFFDTATPSPSPMSPGPSLSPMSPGPSLSPMSPGPSPPAMSPGQSPQAPQPPTPPPPQQQPQQQPPTPPPPQQQPSTPPSPQQQPQQQPSTSSPAPSTCPPGYNLNTSNSPGYGIAQYAGLDANYCYTTISKPNWQAPWPTCPTGSTQFQIDALNENCYVPKVG